MRCSVVLGLFALISTGCPTADGDADTGAASTAATMSGTSAPTGGPTPLVGRPCDHAGNVSASYGVQLTPADPACDGDFCAFARDEVPLLAACTVDADCVSPAYICVDSACTFSTSYKLAHSMCAPACEDDAGCAVEDPATACASGFACVAISPSCCAKRCYCSDDLNAGSVDKVAHECELSGAIDCAAITPS